MKLLHLSDLHLGKRVNEFSMLEDQEYILNKILAVADAEQPDAVLIAGDVYDKSVPSAEAMQLFERFLYGLVRRKLQVFVISGNHDAPERLSFASRLIDASGVHLSPVYASAVEPITLTDAYGDVAIYMLPFLKPAHVRRFFPEAEIASYTDALRTAVGAMGIDPRRRNVLVTHQFVTGAARSDSEDVSVGGTDNVDAAVFDGFDYVALGHIHGPQNIGGNERIRYCGTPLKYSFSEANHRKSVTVVTFAQKGSVEVRTVALTPRHDLRELRGSYMALTAKDAYEGTAVDDYLRITLTDEEEIPDAMAKLRVIYPNLMKLDYDNARTRAHAALDAVEDVERKTPLELFRAFYETQNGQALSAEQERCCAKLIDAIWEGEA